MKIIWLQANYCSVFANCASVLYLVLHRIIIIKLNLKTVSPFLCLLQHIPYLYFMSLRGWLCIGFFWAVDLKMVLQAFLYTDSLSAVDKHKLI